MIFPVLVMVSTAALPARAEPGVTRRHSVGTSLFSVANLAEDAPDFYEVDYGYWLTGRDVVVAHAITWRYDAPLGIPYTSASFGAAEARYPGYVRALGMGAGYRRFLVEGLFVTTTVTPFLQLFSETKGAKVSEGFQLFVVLRAGYHFRLLDDRVYVEPSVAFNFWPVNTGLPADFARAERRWPSYFLFEPGLNLGAKF